LKEKFMPYRYSTLSKYAQCPRAYLYQRDGVPTLDADIMRAGSTAHAIYEAYARHCLLSETETDITAMPEIAARHGVPEGSALYNALIAPWLENGHTFPAYEVIALEETLAITEGGELTQPDAGDCWLHGTVDVIRANDNPALLIIQDYKTGFSTDANPLQMRIYALLALTAYPAYCICDCFYDFTRFNVVKRLELFQADLPVIMAEVRGLAEAIENDEDFTAKPGEHCLSCQWRHTCEAKPECVAIIEDEAQAAQAVEAISLLQRDLDNQKKLLKAWCVSNGPVSRNGVEWGNHVTGTDGFNDARQFHEAALAIGEDPLEYMTVDNRRAARLRRKGEWPEELAAILENRRCVRFSGKKERHT
jgi:hypothetical protein